MRLTFIAKRYPVHTQTFVSEPLEWLREAGVGVSMVAAKRGDVGARGASALEARILSSTSRRTIIASLLGAPLTTAAVVWRNLQLQNTGIPLREALWRAMVPEVRAADAVVAHFGSVGARWLVPIALARKPMVVYEQGLVEFDPEKQQFEKVVEFEMNAPAVLGGHPLKHAVDGVEYVYFANPFPLVRVRADVEDLKDPSRYESFTCLKEGSRLDDVQLDRAAGGTLQYGWKQNTPPMDLDAQRKLVEAGRLTREEALPHLSDIDTGKPILAHRGTVYWNDYRRRWVMIATETFGTSVLGEVWYAEADTLEGPWAYARKIVTHDKYSFYNPKQHPMFDKEGGRIVFFEGTYTNTFSGNPDQTPRYDYNQVMYKLDLSDPRLVLPVPVYRLADDEKAPSRFGTVERLGSNRQGRSVAFFACDRPRAGTVPVYQGADGGPERGLRAGASPDSLLPTPHSQLPTPEPLFYALPAQTESPPALTVPLFEYVHEDGVKRDYRPGGSQPLPGYRREEPPVCLIWRDPTTANGCGSSHTETEK